MHCNDLEEKTSSVEGIINALSDLEKDMDNLDSKVEEMEKRLVTYSNEEIEDLNKQIIALANNQAKKIVDLAKSEAEKESSLIVDESDNNLTKIKQKIESSYDKAVDTIVKMILSAKDYSDSNKDIVEFITKEGNIPSESGTVSSITNSYTSAKPIEEKKVL